MRATLFEARYTVPDGSGNSRPQHFKISSSELEDGMTDADLARFYEIAVQGHFEQNIGPESERVSEFIAWANKCLADRSGV